ncbi:MAG: hypothetical protein ACOC4M_08175 [Promethearchaeia archaeon]
MIDALIVFGIILLGISPIDFLVLVFYMDFNSWGSKFKIKWNEFKLWLVTKIQRYCLDMMWFYSRRILRKKKELKKNY